MRFGISLELSQEKIESIYYSILTVLTITKSFLVDSYLEDNYIIFVFNEDKDSLHSLLYDLSKDFIGETKVIP